MTPPHKQKDLKAWLEFFDEKYGYEYPRCALIMKNVEVRDEDEKLIGHTNTAAVTPEELKFFITALAKDLTEQSYRLGLEEALKVVKEMSIDTVGNSAATVIQIETLLTTLINQSK